MKRLILLAGMIYPALLLSQQMNGKTYNLETFRDRSPQISEELLEATPAEYQSHPEFGILPYDAPCTDCYELIHERTDSTRKFVINNTGGRHFAIQTALGVLNYKDADGRYYEFNNKLEKAGADLLISDKKFVTSYFDFANHQTRLKMEQVEVAFNNQLRMQFVAEDGTVTDFGPADWSNYTMGNDGARIINAWPNVDIQLINTFDGIKTSYILHEKPGLGNGHLVFSDHFEVPEGFALHYKNAAPDEYDHMLGQLALKNAQNEEVLSISEAYGYDNSGERTGIHPLAYTIESTVMKVWVGSDWLENPATAYPVLIDPSVSSSASLGQAAITGSRYNGSCNFTNSCNYTLNAPSPANATINDVTFSFSYYAYGWCYMQDGAMRVAYNGCVSPSTPGYYWFCNTIGGGTCNGANIPIFTDVGSCVPAPACGSYTMPFTLQFFQSCWGAGGCSNDCVQAASPFSVTIFGSTLETLGNTASGNGTQSIVVASCSGNTVLNPAPQNGVPTYSYLWSVGGQTTPTVTVPSVSTGPHTVQVTDACGVTRTATFVIVCPLAVDYLYFKAEKINRNVLLQWETGSEKDNDHFRVERSFDGLAFEALADIGSKDVDGSVYAYTDYDVRQEENVYYRIVNVDHDANEEFTDIQVIHFDPDNPDLMLIPNPNKGAFNVLYNAPYTSTFTLEVMSGTGRVILSKQLELEKGNVQIPVNISGAAKGVYTVRLITQNQSFTEKLVIE